MKNKIDQAYELGQVAHAQGKTSTPFFDQKFMKSLINGSCLEMLESWELGWHTSNAGIKLTSE